MISSSAPPEDRHRVAGERGAHQDVVEDRAASDASDDASRQPDGERDQQGAERQLDGRREQGQELRQYRLAGDDRLAEIAMGEVVEIDEVLLPERLVEAELGEELGVPLGERLRSPTRSSIGSPGIRRISEKATMVTPMKVGIRTPRRAMMKRSIDQLIRRRPSALE